MAARSVTTVGAWERIRVTRRKERPAAISRHLGLAMAGVFLSLTTAGTPAGVAQEASPTEARDPGGRLTGRVLGFRGEPLAGASVLLTGPEGPGSSVRTRPTGPRGEFAFDGLEPGAYTVGARHPHPLLAALPGPVARAEIRAGMAIPPLTLTLRFDPSAVAAALCGEETEEGPVPARGVLVGRILEEESDGPAREAVLWLTIPPADGGERSEGIAVPVRADETGGYVACGVPAGLPLSLQATAIGRAGPRLAATLTAGEVRVWDLRVAPAVAGSGLPAAKVGDRDGIVVRGVVRDPETGEAVSGARVRLLDTDLVRVTGPEGTFVMSGLRPGRQRIVAEYLGMSSDTATVSLGSEPVVALSLLLQTRPVELPELRVEVENTYRSQKVADFYRRMDRGTGDFITHEELAHRDLIGALRRLPSVQVEQCVGAGGVRTAGCWQLDISRGVGIGQRTCRAALYVDGSRVAGDDFNYLLRLPRDLIEGVEVYRGVVGQPAQFTGVDTQCGLVLVWTRGRG